jgi:putative phosphoesterase
VRVLIFADLHANWEALQALQAAEQQPDVLLFLGDAVGYGPDPAHCVAWLRQNVTHAVRGNHDDALLSRQSASVPDEYRALAEETWLHARWVVSAPDQAWLARLPLTQALELGGVRFVLAHAAPNDPLGPPLNLLTASDATLEGALGNTQADVVLVGHTHVPAIRRVGRAATGRAATEGRPYVVNPGSLGQPRYGVPDATYAVWQDGDLRIQHLHYPHELTAQKLGMLPLDPDVVEALQAILERGG